MLGQGVEELQHFLWSVDQEQIFDQELAAWEKADASAGSKPAAQLEPSHAAQVASMQKLYELNRMEVLLAQSKKLAGLNV